MSFPQQAREATLVRLAPASLAAALLALGLLASGCRRGPATQQTTATTASAGLSTAPAAPVASLPPASSSAGLPGAASSAPGLIPAPSASSPLSPEEQAQARIYEDSLGHGRLLSLKQEFPDAIVSFSQALRARPDDPRALAERGYARLQTEDLDGAERDFYAAIDHHPERAVLSAAIFNLALVAERRGNKEQAAELRESARSNRIPRPPAGRCDADIPRGKYLQQDNSTIQKFQTLRQVRTELVSRESTPPPGASPLPTTDEEAILLQDMLGGGDGPWLITRGTDEHLLFGKPLAYTLISNFIHPWGGYRCGYVVTHRIDMSHGHPILTVFSRDENWTAHCPKNPVNPEFPCYAGCDGPLFFTQDIRVYDRETGHSLFAILHRNKAGKDEQPVDQVSLTLRDNGVQLFGAGCNRFEPFKR